MVNSGDFAKRLEKILEYYSLSASAFADAIDFNRSSISHLLSGRNKPSLEFVMKVLDTFPEVKLYWLLNGKGNFPESEEKEVALQKEKRVTSHPAPSLFSETEIKTNSNSEEKNITAAFSAEKNSSAIERIVIFHKDGSFKVYENQGN